jgi:hypothetical protein
MDGNTNTSHAERIPSPVFWVADSGTIHLDTDPSQRRVEARKTSTPFVTPASFRSYRVRGVYLIHAMVPFDTGLSAEIRSIRGVKSW